MKITIFLLLFTLLFTFNSCIDEDKLKEEEGYHLETYFLKGHFNDSPLFKSSYLGNKQTFDPNDFSDIYNETHNYQTSTEVDTFKLNIHFLIPKPNLYKIGITSTNMNNFNNKTFYFTHPMLMNQEPLSEYIIKKDKSYLKVDTIIFPDETFAFPRVMGSLYLIGEKDGDIDTLNLNEFELPFSQGNY